MNTLFRKILVQGLYYEEFTADEINRIVNALGDIRISRSSDRRVLGSINDLIKQYEYDVKQCETAGDDQPEIQKRLNKTPLSVIKYTYPVSRFREIVVAMKLER